MTGKRPAWVENWLRRHRSRLSRWLQMLGIPLTVAAVVLAFWQLYQWRRDLWYRPGALLAAGYLLQFLGRAYEGDEMREIVSIKRLLGRCYTVVSPRYEHRNM